MTENYNGREIIACYDGKGEKYRKRKRRVVTIGENYAYYPRMPKPAHMIVTAI